jgi:NAD(P)-dependent dehydrogenase (short-subunit alcohol dehydrogenase family)
VRASLQARIPQRRLGSTDEIARVVLFLASGDSSFMTGEEIVVAETPPPKRGVLTVARRWQERVVQNGR